MKNPSASAKVIRAICLTAAFLWATPYLFLYIFGKNIIIDHLARITGQTVTAGTFSLTPSFGMELQDVSLGDLGSVKSLRVVPRLASVITPQFIFDDIVLTRPELTIKRTAAMISVSQGVQGAQGTPAQAVVSLKPSGNFHASWEFPILVRRLAVNDGTVHWVDKMVKSEGLVVTVNNITILVKNFAAAFPVITQFSAQGTIPWHHASAWGTVALDGWVNFFKNDIQAKLSISDIDATDLQPYYSRYYDLEKARVEKANLHFSSDIRGLDNNVFVQCRIELSNIRRSARNPDEPRQKDERITDVVLNRLKAVDKGEVNAVEFSFKTRMDQPEFALGIVKNAVETKLSRGRTGNLLKPEGILLFPGRLLVGVVQGVTEVSKGMIDGGFAVGNELRKAVSSSFEKDRPK